MALKGKLRDFNTTQLLNLVSLAKKTGVMTFETEADSARLFFKDGKLIHASTNNNDGRLADILYAANKITPEQLRAIKKHQSLTDKALGIDLIKGKIVSQYDIIQSVKDFMLDIVYTLFEWTDGSFNFQQGEEPPPHLISVPLNLDNVILEGSRRIQEHERLMDELPDLSVIALKVTDKPLRDVKLTPEDWRVISHIHPRNSIEQIAKINNMDDFQIRKIVYGMLQAGLVELTKPETLKKKQKLARRKHRESEPTMKTSVIKRLITRIKGI